MGSAQRGPRAHSHSPTPRLESSPQPRGGGPEAGHKRTAGSRGYLETKDQEQKAGGRHVEADGDEAGERGEQVEEEGLVQALQEVVEFAEHALQSPAGRGLGSRLARHPRAPTTPPRVCKGQTRRHSLADRHQVILILAEAIDATES